MLFRVVLASFLTAALLCDFSVAAQAARPPDRTDSRVAAALLLLRDFKQFHSLDDLHAAAVALTSAYNIGAITPATFIARRRTLAGAWAQIIKSIDDSYDPSFDPSEQLFCPMPPLEASGRQLPPCVTPDSVKDPAARTEYVARLSQFKLRIQRHNYYRQLRNIDELATLSFRMTLSQFNSRAPDGAGPDFAAIDAILRKAGLSDARRAQIEPSIYGNP
jgi:hypothetical protein